MSGRHWNKQNGQLTIYWNQNGYRIESGYNTDALTDGTQSLVLNGGMAEFYVDDEQVGSAAFTLPAGHPSEPELHPHVLELHPTIGQLDYVQLWL